MPNFVSELGYRSEKSFSHKDCVLVGVPIQSTHKYVTCQVLSAIKKTGAREGKRRLVGKRGFLPTRSGQDFLIFKQSCLGEGSEPWAKSGEKKNTKTHKREFEVRITRFESRSPKICFLFAKSTFERFCVIWCNFFF